MRRFWTKIGFEFVGSQPALVCYCHEDLVQLLKVDFLAILEELDKSIEPDCPHPPTGQKETPFPSVPTTASSGHHNHDGYTSSPPHSDPHDPFGSQQNHQRYYYDGSEDPYIHCDTIPWTMTFTAIGTENAIMINLAAILTVRCSLELFQRYPM